MVKILVLSSQEVARSQATCKQISVAYTNNQGGFK